MHYKKYFIVSYKVFFKKYNLSHINYDLISMYVF